MNKNTGDFLVGSSLSDAITTIQNKDFFYGELVTKDRVAAIFTGTALCTSDRELYFSDAYRWISSKGQIYQTLVASGKLLSPREAIRQKVIEEQRDARRAIQEERGRASGKVVLSTNSGDAIVMNRSHNYVGGGLVGAERLKVLDRAVDIAEKHVRHQPFGNGAYSFMPLRSVLAQIGGVSSPVSENWKLAVLQQSQGEIRDMLMHWLQIDQ